MYYNLRPVKKQPNNRYFESADLLNEGMQIIFGNVLAVLLPTANEVAEIIVFAPVCDSVHRGVSVWRGLCPGGSLSLSGGSLSKRISVQEGLGGSLPWGYLPGGLCPGYLCLGGPSMGVSVPTGMFSCDNSVLFISGATRQHST